MFYPVESLKRGGRFYLCWVADSWPLRFLNVTQRQLWSQDIRVLCDDLLEVIKNESGRPTNRFSLRLSSQLMRGLVRLYQKKVMVLIAELCMLNANVFKHSNKKNQKDRPREHRATTAIPIVTVTAPDGAEIEQRLEELIQNSGNVVGNIQEITLRETAIPDFQVPNDGFGDENALQQLQQLTDMSVEMMLVQDPNIAQQTSLELPQLDITEKSHDQSRLPVDRAMERISELDMTLFRKSTAADLVPPSELDKDIPDIPEIPLIPPPDIPVPEIEKQVEPPPVQDTPAAPQLPQAEQPPQEEFEELEEIELQPKRRRLKKLIIDKKTKLSSEYLRSRIDHNDIELRCEDFSDDIIEIRVPTTVLFRRPCHSGLRATSTINWELLGLFERNFEVIPRPYSVEREMEEMLFQRCRRQHTVLECIPEEEQIPLVPEIPEIQPIEKDVRVSDERDIELNMSKSMMNVTVPRLTMEENLQEDIADLPTQKLETLSQRAKRVSEFDRNAKRQRSGCTSFKRKSQELATEVEHTNAEETKKNKTQKRLHIPDVQIFEGEQDIPIRKELSPELKVTTMLQEAGLADLPVEKTVESSPEQRSQKKRKSGSESTETQLGSLDRTKVSLGDSVKTTDSQKFIRDQWGTEGTMLKILSMVQVTKKVKLNSLIAKGPVIAGLKKIIVARCFTSLLKLKQHGFIKITKDPETLEIVGIALGEKFD